MCAGNAAEASRRLKTQDVVIGERTLRSWLDRHPAEYADVRQRLVPQIEAGIIHDARTVAREAIDGAREAIALERQRIAAGEVKDAGASARNLATAGATWTDKMLLLDGRPNSIEKPCRSTEELMRSIAAKLGGFREGEPLPWDAEGQAEPEALTHA
jgi:hypothetical protein